MPRRLTAALACRNDGTRLFGKPLQILDRGRTILDQILDSLSHFQIIDDVCLGISEGAANLVFQDIAESRGIPFIVGSEIDVLDRLIRCAEKTEATDVFRVTTECPFFHYEMLPLAWDEHLTTNADITVCDMVPSGMSFEIYTIDALRRSHAEGEQSDRSEYCSNFARRNRHLFAINVLTPDEALQRPDLRVTVDYPEDLILCRALYSELAVSGPLVPLEEIVRFLDAHPELKELVAPYASAEPVWAVAGS